MKGSFLGFPWVGQSALCFLVRRLSKFLQLFAVIQSCRGNYFVNLSVSCLLFNVLYDFRMFSILNIGILFLGGKCSRFLFVSLFLWAVCVYYEYAFFLIGCDGSVGISLAGRVVYIFRVCISLLWDWRAGTILLGHSGGVDGGTVQIFLLLWLYSGGYCTGEMVRGGDPILFISSICCQFSWRMDIGRNIVLYFLLEDL